MYKYEFLKYPADRPYALQNAEFERYQHPTSLAEPFVGL